MAKRIMEVHASVVKDGKIIDVLQNPLKSDDCETWASMDFTRAQTLLSVQFPDKPIDPQSIQKMIDYLKSAIGQDWNAIEKSIVDYNKKDTPRL